MTDALPPRTATIRSRVPHAESVAVAIAADDTEDIDTRAEDGAVVADLQRPTTASLEATVDDYVVALDVATRVAGVADAVAPDDSDGSDTESSDDPGGSDDAGTVDAAGPDAGGDDTDADVAPDAPASQADVQSTDRPDQRDGDASSRAEDEHDTQ